MPTLLDSVIDEIRAGEAVGFVVRGSKRTPLEVWELTVTRGIRGVTEPRVGCAEYEPISNDNPTEDARKYTLGVVTDGTFTLDRKYDVVLSVGKTPEKKDGAYIGRGLIYTGRTELKRDSDGKLREYKIFEGTNRLKTAFNYQSLGISP